MIHFHEWNGECYYRDIITNPLEVQMSAMSVIMWKSSSLCETLVLCILSHSLEIFDKSCPFSIFHFHFWVENAIIRYAALGQRWQQNYLPRNLERVCETRVTETRSWSTTNNKLKDPLSVSDLGCCGRVWHLQISLAWRQLSRKAIQTALDHSGW